MEAIAWYKNGSRARFHRFCIQNRFKLISVRLLNVYEPIKGLLYHHRLRPLRNAGVYLLLTRTVIHPAFYSFEEINSLHSLDFCQAPFIDFSLAIQPISTDQSGSNS